MSSYCQTCGTTFDTTTCPTCLSIQKHPPIAQQGMRVMMAYVHFPEKGPISSTAKISVDGLGEVEIKDVISAEMGERLKIEAIAALRVRLGQRLEKDHGAE